MREGDRVQLVMQSENYREYAPKTGVSLFAGLRRA